MGVGGAVPRWIRCLHSDLCILSAQTENQVLQFPHFSSPLHSCDSRKSTTGDGSPSSSPPPESPHRVLLLHLPCPLLPPVPLAMSTPSQLPLQTSNMRRFSPDPLPPGSSQREPPHLHLCLYLPLRASAPQDLTGLTPSPNPTPRRGNSPGFGATYLWGRSAASSL